MNVSVCGLIISRLIGLFLTTQSHAFYKYFWCSQFCEFHRKPTLSGHPRVPASGRFMDVGHSIEYHHKTSLAETNTRLGQHYWSPSVKLKFRTVFLDIMYPTVKVYFGQAKACLWFYDWVRLGKVEILLVVSKMDTCEGWTPHVYYTTLYFYF